MGSDLQVPIVLRVKRHRDSQAPQEIVLEARSRTSAITTQLEASLTLQATAAETATAAELAPPRKRCRFVLLASSSTPGEGLPDHAKRVPSPLQAGAEGGLACQQRVLDVWHTDKLENANSLQSQTKLSHITLDDVPNSNLQTTLVHLLQHQQHQADDPVYQDLLDQYLQQQQQPQQQQQQSTSAAYKLPSKAVRQSHQQAAHDNIERPTTVPNAMGWHPYSAGQQGGHHQQIPLYMTRGMLSQLSDEMTDLPSVPEPVPQFDAATDCQAAVHHAPTPGEYVYDVYVPLQHSMGGNSAKVHSNQSSLQRQHCPANIDADAEAADAPIIHVWEEDLLDCDHLWTGKGPGSTAAADDDSEDSNAEGHYANSYPDEEASYQYSEDEGLGQAPYTEGDAAEAAWCGAEADPEDDGDQIWPDERAQQPSGSGISSYQPRHHHWASSNSKVIRQHRQKDQYYDIGEEEFDVDDYVSSGDEAAIAAPRQGRLGLSGGPAWRAMVAGKYCGPSAAGVDEIEL